ncbi:MAG: RNA polymerase factor sigma-32 [Alphaproteobacteria bacterium]|nr:RNA polymerase factor sigma-32 [Alphaproteobacteria bacterium]
MITKSVNFNVTGNLPANINDGGIANYINMVKNIPHLSAEEEYDLAVKVYENHDIDAAEKLIKSNLFLVVATAFEYKGYGLPISDIISEGNIGLMKAVKKYDPKKGFRLSTYALWWIRATINEFVLSSWSLVKIGTQTAQKKLFFSLKKLKAKLGIYHDNNMTNEEVKKIAEHLDVEEAEVVEMNNRMVKDSSLNKLISSDDNDSDEKLTQLVATTPNSEEIVGENEDTFLRRKMLFDALQTLNPREQFIIKKRRLQENPATLEELSEELKISKERVRQIENRAMEKLTVSLKSLKNN